MSRKAGDDDRGVACVPVKSASTDKNLPSPYLLGSDGCRLFRSACRARGVAEDHTAETAYLLIPEDAPHGYFMRCSHRVCIKTGRQFRYCAVCRQAVTRRNFHKRHDHGLIRYDEDGRPILPPADRDATLQVVSSSHPQPSAVGKQQSKRPPQSNTSRRFYAENYFEAPKAANESVKRREISRLGVVSDDEVRKIESAASFGARANEAADEELWLKLFRERPKGPQDRTAMTKWIASLLQTSYPRAFPNKAAAAAAAAVARSSQSESSSDEDLLVVELDAVLGDFDKNLDGFDGDWGLTDNDF